MQSFNSIRSRILKLEKLESQGDIIIIINELQIVKPEVKVSSILRHRQLMSHFYLLRAKILAKRKVKT